METGCDWIPDRGVWFFGRKEYRHGAEQDSRLAFTSTRSRDFFFTPGKFTDFEFKGTEIDELAVPQAGRLQVPRDLSFICRTSSHSSLVSFIAPFASFAVPEAVAGERISAGVSGNCKHESRAIPAATLGRARIPVSDFQLVLPGSGCYLAFPK
jgi:hypothetical protein